MMGDSMDDNITPIIKIDGPYFYRNRDRFIARGIVYKPFFQRVRRRELLDPLHDAHYGQLLENVQKFKELRINTIWVTYHDPSLPHNESMTLLAQKDIYVIFDAYDNAHCIADDHPSASYTDALLNHMSKVIDSVARYRNTLGICLDRVNINDFCAQKFEKIEESWTVYGRLIRDLKQYMRYRNHDTGQRIIPITINDGQWSSLNSPTFHYLCNPTFAGRPAGGRLDFYSFAHFTKSREMSMASNTNPAATPPRAERIPALANLGPLPQPREPDLTWSGQLPLERFENAEDPIPILVSEYGDNFTRPRKFEEVKELYGTAMDSPLLNTISGGFAHEYSEGIRPSTLLDYRRSGKEKKYMEYFDLRDAMCAAVGVPPPPPEEDTDMGEDSEDVQAPQR